MRLGVFGVNAGATHGPESTVEIARLAEELGYDSIWAGEHVVAPSPRVRPSPMDPTDPILDPLVHLTFVAGVTRRIQLATGIVILPQRNPLVLAKQVASLDVLSGGRLTLGIGAGYLEPEMTAIGVPMADRGTRTDDYLAAMRAIWTQPGPVAHDGPLFRFAGVDAHPRPVQTGGPRVVVGGHSPPAFRRAMAHGHGWYGFALSPESAAACIEGLRRAASEVERPAELGELEITVTPPAGRRFGEAAAGPLDAAAVEAYEKVGVHRLVPYLSGAPSPEAAADRLRTLADLVL